MVKYVSPRGFRSELLLFLVCREALLILPAFQPEEQKEVEVTCPANQKGGQPLGKMRIRHHPVYLYANHEQLSMRDRENGEADSHGSEKKGR